MNVTNPVIKVLLYIAAGIGIIAICGILFCCGSLAFVTLFADTGPTVPPTMAPTRVATTMPLATPNNSFNGNLLWPTGNQTQLAPGSDQNRYYHNLQSLKGDLGRLGLAQTDIVKFQCQEAYNEAEANIFVSQINSQTCSKGFITTWPDTNLPQPR
jgi:hypothetical protein